jgi:hypothetical protein
MEDLSTKTFSEIILGIATTLSEYFVTLFASISVLLFIWGVTKYVYKGDSEAERTKGKNLMFWGIIALFVLFGIWGILELLANTFGIEFDVPPQFKY